MRFKQKLALAGMLRDDDESLIGGIIIYKAKEETKFNENKSLDFDYRIEVTKPGVS